MPQLPRKLLISKNKRKLDKIGSQVAELNEVLPVIERLAGLLSNLDALGPRSTLLDQLSHNFNSFNADFQVAKSQLASFGEFTKMTENLRPIVQQYLDQNHLISESVRLDVEALTVHLLALQLQIDRLITVINNAE